ncbi:MAG: acyltransferase family protein [Mucilaginibacter sp.]
MELLIDNKAKKDFKVIDTIRFLAICSIVWGHCNLGFETANFRPASSLIIQSIALQTGRIGTIIFFLISGFLIGPKIQSYTPFIFLKHRFKSTILPWLIFVILFSMIVLANSPTLKQAFLNRDFHKVLLINSNVVMASVFYFAYWFIVVFIISALVLIAFKRNLNNGWFGAALALITLFYSINLHYGWVSVHHTKAFLGYAFFMWLGIQLNRYYQLFVRLLHNTSWHLLIVLFAVSFLFACYEGFYLSKTGCADPYASIRLSNIFNSLIAFACLFKIGNIGWINRLEPRRVVYGVYLLHNILICVLINFYASYISNANTTPDAYRMLFTELIAFAFILTTSILLVNIYAGKYTAVFLNMFGSISNTTQLLTNQIILNIRQLSLQPVYAAGIFVLLFVYLS